MTHLHHARRRGVTSVLAMLFLVLFGTMALGFYAATTTQTQVAANDASVSASLLAAESGMDFMRYQLARVRIPPGTPSSNVITELYKDLQASLNGTGNLGAYSISRNGNVISIPAGDDQYIKLDSGGDRRFRATITDWVGEIVVKVDGVRGTADPIHRYVTMDFTRRQVNTSAFNYAVASRGQVLMKKGAVTTIAGVDPAIATVMSAMQASGAINVTGGTIGGDISILDGASALVSGGSVGGSSIPSQILANHTHVVDPPEFPTVDTQMFKQYATNAYVSGKSVQSNIRIPANTNPSFAGGDSVQGVMYIESPNLVTFRGNFNLQGFIVFEDKNNETVNQLDIRGSIVQSPLPAGSQFDTLRSTSGVSILAPSSLVTISGATDSLLRGNVIIGKFDYQGSADVQIDQGTIMALNSGAAAVSFAGKTVKFTATGANNQATNGVSYSGYYSPKPSTYLEVTP